MKFTSCLFAIASILVVSFGDAQNLRRLEVAKQQQGSVVTNATRSKATAQLKRDQLKAYFKHRRSQMKIIATTVTDSGHVLDWVRPTALATPPKQGRLLKESNTSSKQDKVSAEGLFELFQQPHNKGPPNTVPVLRIEAIVDKMDDADLPESVQDYLSKYGDHNDQGSLGGPRTLQNITKNSPHHRHLGTEPIHKYVATREVTSTFGGEAFINTWDPFVEIVSSEFTLAQVAVAAGIPALTAQTVECGWQKFPKKYADTYPHLFVFYTTNNYASQRDYEGGYNSDVDGFVQYSSTIYPGARITTPLSNWGGTQYSMQVKVQLYQGNWWIGVAGQWMGYYPAKLFANQPGGLQFGGSRIDWYGELLDTVDNVPTRTWMGSGKFASGGFGNAAYMRNIRTYQTSCGCSTIYSPQGYYVTNSDCYSYDPYFDSGTSWGSYFFFGGPGAFANKMCNVE